MACVGNRTKDKRVSQKFARCWLWLWVVSGLQFVQAEDSDSANKLSSSAQVLTIRGFIWKSAVQTAVVSLEIDASFQTRHGDWVMRMPGAVWVSVSASNNSLQIAL